MVKIRIKVPCSTASSISISKNFTARNFPLTTFSTLARPRTRSATDIRSVSGGILVQDADIAGEIKRNVVTKRRPTKTELNAMLFGWRVVKHVKSNAIVYSKADRTLGVGAGQMSRI